MTAKTDETEERIDCLLIEAIFPKNLSKSVDVRQIYTKS